ncbi:type II toxin-antitoxin system RelE/ParE family toxin [Verminephrobacter eiseniae]|uniref:type II toxin-antitoxin system RelE/ParE family toxin n=1 Tax=Verminephrobacter eiseniae TaxID=364317 RepID=UPI0022384537|nr:type II toxin-antitoxin system RelE/ParE family toxin [Verminephrobacter eiseniae]
MHPSYRSCAPCEAEGTSGVRKLRWRRGGQGKSGGVRVIYYYHDDLMPLYLLTLFAKGDKANLTKAERNDLVSRHRSSVGLRWPSKRIAALHRLPIRSVLSARCALRCAPMAARSLRHLIRDATLADLVDVLVEIWRGKTS